MHRRRVLQLLPAVALALAVACGGGDTVNTSKNVATTSPTGSGAASSAVTSPSGGQPATGQPKGELKLAFGIHMPSSLDAMKDGFSLIFVGAGETLTRLNIEQKVEPWLAEKVEQKDATTWRATVRKNAQFHDGSSVKAEDVVASWKRSWETQPAANNFIPKDTTVTAVDASTVEFKLSKPIGGFLNQLSAFQFVIHKPGPQGGASLMTGMYKPVKLETDNLISLEAFAGHWGGPPPIAKLSIKAVPDANARALALQSGDVDMVFNLPAELVKGLPATVEKAVIPSTRMHMMMFNHARPLFADRAVREATMLALDRTTINKVALDGLGAVAVGVYPPNTAVEVVSYQTTDVNRAKQILETAGWKPGADGVRAKDGTKLSFTLLSYPGRAELTPMAVNIQSQLKALGYDVQVQEVKDITAELNKGSWDASMYSVGTLPTGDPLYLLAGAFVKNGNLNLGNFTNAKVDTLIEQLRSESDTAKRAALAKEIQETVKGEVPNVYLAGAPLGYFYKKDKVAGTFKPNPNDLYFIDRTLMLK